MNARIILVLMLVAIACAQKKPKPSTNAEVEEAFKKGDTNQDGTLNKKEFVAIATKGYGTKKADAEKIYEKIDMNKDKKVTLQEAKAYYVKN